MAEYGQGIVNTTQVNLDTATVELTTLVETSTSISPATYYCNFPANTFSSILAQVMETDAQIVLSSGTFSETSLIDLSANVGLALVAPAVFPPITQFDFSLQASAANIRLSHLEIYGTFVIKSTNSSVSHCLFESTVNIRQCNRDIHFDSCEFRAPITVEVSFAPSGDAIIPVVTFNNCDFRGTSFVLNQTYPYQVVFRGCRNFANFSATNARYVGINTLTDGNTIKNSITELVINGETKVENYLYTAGTAGNPDYWSPPFSLPTNTVKNNMLIASETGVLSWTASPVSLHTYYCNASSGTTLSTVVSQMGSNAGSQIIMSSGTFNGSAVSLVNDNQAIVGSNCQPAITELLMAITVSGTRMRLSHLQIEAVATLTGNACVYSNCDFVENTTIGSNVNTRYISVVNCEFGAGKTLTINALGNTEPVYFINCNFTGATITVNTSSPLQCIFNNCAGFLALPSTANATLVGLNVLASGIINNSVQRTILASGRGTSGQVLLSGGASANDTWGSAPADATKYDVSGGNITGNVSLSATKSITADIININNVNMKASQNIGASGVEIDVVNTLTRIIQTNSAIPFTCELGSANTNGFIKIIQKINSNPTGGANATITSGYFNLLDGASSIVLAGVGACVSLIWDTTTEQWRILSINSSVLPQGFSVSGDITINTGYKLDIPRVLVAGSAGTAGQVLTSGGAGASSWTTVSGGGGGIPVNNGAGTGATTLESLAITAVGTTNTTLTATTSAGTTMIQTGGNGYTVDELHFINSQAKLKVDKPLLVKNGYGVMDVNTNFSTIGLQLSSITYQARANRFNSTYPTTPDSLVQTWNDRIWNASLTPVGNPIPSSTGNGGQYISINKAGNYKITWSSTVYSVNESATRLQLLLSGDNYYGTTTSDNGFLITQASTGCVIIPISQGDGLILQHYTTTGTQGGLGTGTFYPGDNTIINAWITVEDVGGVLITGFN